LTFSFFYLLDRGYKKDSGDYITPVVRSVLEYPRQNLTKPELCIMMSYQSEVLFEYMLLRMILLGVASVVVYGDE
jgi:hypothetical protein